MNLLSGILEMKRIPVSDEGSYKFLRTDEVLAIQSDGDYCKIYTPGGKSHYLHSSLKSMLQRYTIASFFRVHKGFIVNLAHVSKLTRDEKGRTRIILDNGSTQPIPVARRRLAALKEAMSFL